MAQDHISRQAGIEAHALGDGRHGSDGRAFGEEGRGGVGSQVLGGEQGGETLAQPVVQQIVRIGQVAGQEGKGVAAQQRFFVRVLRAHGQHRRGHVWAVEGLRHQRFGSQRSAIGGGEQAGVGHEAAFLGGHVDHTLHLAQHFGQALGHIVFELPGAVDGDSGDQAGGHPPGEGLCA